MKSAKRVAFIYALALIVSISLAIQFASASERDASGYSATELSEEELDSVLAPIALYPDTLLTHVLIASTYPMDVIRAARWRDNNDHLSADAIRDRVDVFDWDPSVKALAPFDRVLTQMSEDIDWLNFLGDAVIADEGWVMSRIQVLRDHAYREGQLRSNEYVDVDRDDDVVVIESVKERVVYVPYYDTRVVYGNWWHVHRPYYWSYPRHYRYRAGFYWSPSIHIASHFFFGGFHWHHRYVVVNYDNHYRPYYRDHKRVYTREYRRWNHNVQHRRARYADRVIRHRNVRHADNVKVVRNKEVNTRRYGQYQPAQAIKLQNKSRTVTRNTTVKRSVNRNQLQTSKARSVQRSAEVTRQKRVETPRKAVTQPRTTKRQTTPVVRSPKQDAQRPTKRTIEREVNRQVTRQKQSVQRSSTPQKRTVQPRSQQRTVVKRSGSQRSSSKSSNTGRTKQR